MAKTVDSPDEYIPTTNFYFVPKRPAPKNFDDLEINSDASVTVKGKITAIRHDQNGKSFEITTGKVEISPSGTKPMSTAAGMAKIKEKRTL